MPLGSGVLAGCVPAWRAFSYAASASPSEPNFTAVIRSSADGAHAELGGELGEGELPGGDVLAVEPGRPHGRVPGDRGEPRPAEHGQVV